MVKPTVLLLLVMAAWGCEPLASEHLSFPAEPLKRTPQGIWYSVKHKGQADFALLADEKGKLDILAYDDQGNGQFNRTYRLSDYANQSVPHLIILMDSIPYTVAQQEYASGRFAWFDPPQKVIPPFPSLTELIFTTILGAPPMAGMIDEYYDPRDGEIQSGYSKRLKGYREPWERRCQYIAGFWEGGASYAQPRRWLQAELSRTKLAVDDSPNRVTPVYLISTSGMVCRFGRIGAQEALAGVERLCMQLMYERCGAIKISIMADHGHNMMESHNCAFTQTLTQAGFHVTDQLKEPNDVVIDQDGLITYLGMHTAQAGPVAQALAQRKEVELVMFMEQDHVIVRNADHIAAIDCRAGKFRYRPIKGDVLHYDAVIKSLRAAGKADADGFIGADDWFTATVNEQYPDGPQRIWHAFHGMVVNPPDVMLCIHDGYYSGDLIFEHFITMASSHGSLNQINSATFLLSMTGRAKHPLRSREILHVIEPGYTPPVRP